MSTRAKSSIEMECPCGNLILKSYDNGTTKLRSKILLFDNGGGAVAVCKRCGQEHKVPISLSKAFSGAHDVRHYILDRNIPERD